MPKEFLMRGKTASGETEVLEFGHQARPGYGYRMTEFRLYPAVTLGVGTNHELCGTVTADNSAEVPTDPDFKHDGLIASSYLTLEIGAGPVTDISIVNDLFVITQDLILMVQDQGGDSNAINWQCRFEEVKLTNAAEAVANFKQFSIYNTSE